MESEVQELGGGKAGAVALVAYDHDAHVVTDHFGNVVFAAWVESPSEDVAFERFRFDPIEGGLVRQ